MTCPLFKTFQFCWFPYIKELEETGIENGEKILKDMFLAFNFIDVINKFS